MVHGFFSTTIHSLSSKICINYIIIISKMKFHFIEKYTAIEEGLDFMYQ